MYFCIFWN